MGETTYLTCLALYIISFQILSINSRTSTLLRLNAEEGKIVEASSYQVMSEAQRLVEDDPIFNIITSTVLYPDHTWSKQGMDLFCTDCHTVQPETDNGPSTNNVFRATMGLAEGDLSKEIDPTVDETLDCGKSVNFTYYDNLVGVARRQLHPRVPEPQVGLIFTKKKYVNQNGGTVSDVDVIAIEKRLKKAKREKPKSVHLYNQLGNYWRIKGDTRQSIECFRRALAVSPHNADVLLNLARVLFNLQYLDDAIYLTRRSLEMQSPDRNAWQHYFTLGEIFKAYGHYQEAALHLRHTLDLRPDFEPAIVALKEIENIPEATVHVYTLLIIICLLEAKIQKPLATSFILTGSVAQAAAFRTDIQDGIVLSTLLVYETKMTRIKVMGVLLVILSTVDSGGEADEPRSQRHFNRAMAMRSLRGAMQPGRNARTKRGA